MFERFKNDFAVELDKAGFSVQDAQKIIKCATIAAYNYDIKTKEANIVPFGYQSVNERMMLLYNQCRLLEGYSKETMKTQLLTLKNFFTRIDKIFTDVTDMDIRAYLYMYKEEHKTKNQSLEKYRGHINAFYSWLVTQGYIAKNPALVIKKIRGEQRIRNGLTQVELEKIRRACKGKRELAIVDILYSSGCRISELVGLKKEDINWETKEVVLFGKGSKERISYLNARAEVSLKEYFEERGNDGCDSVIASARLNGGKTVGVQKEGIERILRVLGNRVGMHLYPHKFRHTMASTAIQNGGDISEISQILGHASLNTTKIYAKNHKKDVQRMHERCVL